MNDRQQYRRGFATVMALVSLMLVGVTIAGLMTHLSMESRRTQMDQDRAQQEQITIANSLAGAGKSVTLPTELGQHHPF